MFVLTVIFAIWVGHIEFKMLIKNAGLQSYTMLIANRIKCQFEEKY